MLIHKPGRRWTSSTAAGTNYLLISDAGSDVITIGNQTTDFNANVFDGSLDNILGPTLVLPDGWP